MATRLKSNAAPADALETIPGVGPSIARDLRELGYTCVSDLRGENPAQMYYGLCELRDAHIDRCVLYVFRCAVYYASNEVYDADLLKWWNWKDEAVRGSKAKRCTLPANGEFVPAHDCCE
jgi:hypothetical protein